MQHLVSTVLVALALAGAPGLAVADSRPPITQITNYALYCKPMGGGRKAVWMNSDQGTFALNGHAIEWAQTAPLLGSDGQPWKLGRDYIDPEKVAQLIVAGLAECR